MLKKKAENRLQASLGTSIQEISRRWSAAEERHLSNVRVRNPTENFNWPINNNMDTMAPNTFEPTPIHLVFENRKKEDILNMQQHKINLKCKDKNGNTLLHATLKNENLMESEIFEILTILLNHGVDPNFKNNEDITTLCLAIGRRMASVVNILLKFGADMKVMIKGNTLAHYFIEEEKSALTIFNRSRESTKESCEERLIESLSFLEFLISKGLDFDWKNCEGKSVIDLAMSENLQHFLPTLFKLTNEISIYNDDKTLLELFLDKRALERKSYKLTEDKYCSYNAIYAVESVKILLERGVLLRFHDNKHQSFIRKVFEDKEEMIIIKLLIDNFLNYLYANLETTLFHELIDTCGYWNGPENDYFIAALSHLATRGADIDATGKNPVLTAMEANNFRVLEFFRENGLDISLISKKGKNLLHLLAEKNPDGGLHECDFEFGAWYLIVTVGLDVNSKCKGSKTALQLAASHNNVRLARKLIDLGADINHRDEKMGTILHEAVFMDGSVELIEVLMTSGADVNASNDKGEMPLHFAVDNTNLVNVQYLIEHGAIVNCQDRYYQETPLHRAVMKNNSMDIVEFLIAKGADVNAKDYKGNRPIHRAVRFLDVDDYCAKIAMLLLKNGAYVNAQNDTGESPFSYALSFKRLATIKSLMKYKADLNEPRVRKLITDIMSSPYDKNVKLIFLQYQSKMKAANLPYYKHRNLHKARDSQREKVRYINGCLQEVEKLKKTFIDDRTSLYIYLHMNLKSTRAYINNEKLKGIIESSLLDIHFPLYSTLILANYHEAVTRKSLLEGVLKVWYPITAFHLPDIVDKIFDNLKDMDLINFVDASEYKGLM